jgi:hypothetical protein
MADETISPNMNLVIPGVSLTGGPQWATDINTSLNNIDTHDHSFSKGVPVTPAGMSIIANLTMQNNSLTETRSVRYTPLVALPTASTSNYSNFTFNVDLYYRDGLGNNIRLTQNGGVAGSQGSIAGLIPPANVTYLSPTFVFQSNVNVSGNLDAGSVIFRNLTASSPGVTLSAPAALSSSYSLTLPTVPLADRFLSINSAGQFGSTWVVDGATLEISGSTLQVKNLGITAGKVATNTLTTTQTALKTVSTTAAPTNGVLVTVSSGTFTNATTTYATVTGLSGTLVCAGKPVLLSLQAAAAQAFVGVDASAASAGVEIAFLRNAVIIAEMECGPTANEVFKQCPSAFQFIDVTAVAGTYTYSVQVRALGAGATVRVVGTALLAVELH